MSSFFKQTAETMIAKHIDRFPLLKIHFIIDRHPIADYLEQHTCTEHESCIEKLHIISANEHECNHFEPLLQDKDMTAKPIEPYCNIKGFQTALCVRHTEAVR